MVKKLKAKYVNDKFRVIRVTRETHDRLSKMVKQKGDTYDDIIRRLLDEK